MSSVTVMPPRQRQTARHPAVTTGNHHFRAATALAAIALGAIAVLGLWWADTPVVAGWGLWLTNAGRVTGLLAGYGVAVLLILMSRAPALERGLGTDTLARWHSRGGRYTVCLVVAHALLITWGYAVTAHANPASEAGSLLTSYPDVLMATIAGLILIAIGIISARKARAKLRYETWYYLHLYTYLAVALAFSHQFATGADFASNPTARVLWAGLYLAATSLVVVFRIAMPIRAALRHRLRVSDVRRESPDTVSITVTGVDLDDLRAEPGQFFRWRFLNRELWWQSNPYSLSAAPTWHSLRITVKNLGDHSGSLRHLRVGTRVIAEGPYGALTARRRRHRRVLLLAGGVGITPLRALFESMPVRPGDLTLVVRVNHEHDVLLRHELDEIAARKGARVHYLIGPPGSTSDPFVGSRLRELVPDLVHHDVYLCGPPTFMTVAAQRLRACGVPRRYIHREQFSF